MPRHFAFSFSTVLLVMLGIASFAMGDDGTLRTVFLEARMYFQRHAFVVYGLCFAAFIVTLFPQHSAPQF